MRRSTINCQAARELVSLRLDRETSEVCSILLGRHLTGCPECRAFAEATALLTEVLRGQPLELPSRSLVAVPRRGRRALTRSLAAAGSVAVAAVVALAAITIRGDGGIQTQQLFRNNQEQQEFVKRHLGMEPVVSSPERPVVRHMRPLL